MSMLLTALILASAALTVNDVSACDQWALHNNGAFYFEEEKERYYLNGDQIQISQGPGAWADKSLYEARLEKERKDAVSGIDINIDEAWTQYGTGNREVIVAMIDTEIDFSHEDLQGKVWINEDEIPGNGIDDDHNGYIDDVNGWNFSGNNNQSAISSGNKHGTHGAGTICAVSNNGVGISGIVPGDKIKIMPIKVMDDNGGNSSTTLLIRAIKYAQENGADICNLSIVSLYNDSTLYNTMKESPMLFVVAAGNGKAGQDIVLLKWIGLEGTFRVMREKEEELSKRFVPTFLNQIRNLESEIFSEKEMEVAKEFGVSAMHQITSGGILAALWEMSEASGVGIEVDLKKMAIKQETVEVCEFCHLNPYQLTSAGSILVMTDRGEELVQKFEEMGVQASLLGKTTADGARVIIGGEEKRFLERPAVDELMKIYENN